MNAVQQTLQKRLAKRLFVAAPAGERGQQFGCYSVWLCVDGTWTQFVVDDNFPCLEEGGPAFARSKPALQHDLGVLLLEKCCAKALGSYEQIQHGLLGHALRDMTGAPYVYAVRDTDSTLEADEVWAAVEEATKRKGHLVFFSHENNCRQLPLSEEDSRELREEQFRIQIRGGEEL